jgi:hypothetical protein
LPLRWTNLPSVPSVVLPIVSPVSNDRAFPLLSPVFRRFKKYHQFATFSREPSRGVFQFDLKKEQKFIMLTKTVTFP